MVWFFLFIGSVQKYSTKFEYVNRVGFQPVIVLFPLTRTVTAGASNPSVSRKDVTTRTFLSRYLCKDGKPKICRKSPRSNSCRISFRFLWWKTVFQLKAMITFDDFLTVQISTLTGKVSLNKLLVNMMYSGPAYATPHLLFGCSSSKSFGYCCFLCTFYQQILSTVSLCINQAYIS